MADFVANFSELRRGAVMVDVNEAWGELIESVRKHGGKGKLVLTFDVAPTRADDGAVRETEITCKVTLTKPRRQLGKTMFYVAPNNTLTKNDPNQMEMEFQQ